MNIISEVLQLLCDRHFELCEDLTDEVFMNGSPIKQTLTSLTQKEINKINEIRKEYQLINDIIDYIEEKRREN